MASRDVDLIIRAKNRAKPVFKTVTQQAQAMGSRTVGAIKGAYSAIFSLQTLIAGAAAKFAAELIIEPAIRLERAQTEFGVLLKSTDAAKEHLQDLVDFAASTPLTLGDLTATSKRLLSVGVAMEDVVKTMRMLGDAAGGDSERLNRLTNAFAKTRTKGKATMEELNLFLEAGVPILDTLAKQYGVTTAELSKMITAGTVGFPQVEQALVSLTSAGGLYEGMMLKVSETTAGKLSTLKDNWEAVRRDVGNEILPEVIDAVEDLLKVIEDLRASGDLQRWGKNAAVAVETVIAGTKALVTTIKANRDLLKMLGYDFGVIKLLGAATEKILALKNAISPQKIDLPAPTDAEAKKWADETRKKMTKAQKAQPVKEPDKAPTKRLSDAEAKKAAKLRAKQLKQAKELQTDLLVETIKLANALRKFDAEAQMVRNARAEGAIDRMRDVIRQNENQLEALKKEVKRALERLDKRQKELAGLRARLVDPAKAKEADKAKQDRIKQEAREQAKLERQIAAARKKEQTAIRGRAGLSKRERALLEFDDKRRAVKLAERGANDKQRKLEDMQAELERRKKLERDRAKAHAKELRRQKEETRKRQLEKAREMKFRDLTQAVSRQVLVEIANLEVQEREQKVNVLVEPLSETGAPTRPEAPLTPSERADLFGDAPALSPEEHLEQRKRAIEMEQQRRTQVRDVTGFIRSFWREGTLGEQKPQPEWQPEVNVDAPEVMVPAPEVNVDAPEVMVPAPEVNVDAPDTTVPAAEVSVEAPAPVLVPTAEPVVNVEGGLSESVFADVMSSEIDKLAAANRSGSVGSESILRQIAGNTKQTTAEVKKLKLGFV